METFSASLALCEVVSLKKASDAELWWFLWSTPVQAVEQTVEAPVVWDAIAPIMTSLQCFGVKLADTEQQQNTTFR